MKIRLDERATRTMVRAISDSELNRSYNRFAAFRSRRPVTLLSVHHSTKCAKQDYLSIYSTKDISRYFIHD